MATRVGLIVTLLCTSALSVHAQDSIPTAEETLPIQPAIEAGVDYRVYDREGNPSSLLAILRAAVGDDVILVGEEHDDMIGHAFETELFQAALGEIGGGAASGRAVVLSLEMFERDVQYVLDEYLAGMISEDHFLKKRSTVAFLRVPVSSAHRNRARTGRLRGRGERTEAICESGHERWAGVSDRPLRTRPVLPPTTSVSGPFRRVSGAVGRGHG